MDIEYRTVDFENVNQIKKRSVRGLLKKRAKQYESASEDSDDNEDVHIKKKVQKSSMAAAFTSIMNKKLGDTPTSEVAQEAADVTLVKYKKKARDVDEKIAVEDAENKKRILKEQRRLMGRILPLKSDHEHERAL